MLHHDFIVSWLHTIVEASANVAMCCWIAGPSSGSRIPAGSGC